MMNNTEQKIDVQIEDITIQILPAMVHTIRNMMSSMGKLQTAVETEVNKVNSTTLFEPKPFKDANFWFIEDNDEKYEILEETDILEVTTGTPSDKKPVMEEARKQKEKEQKLQVQNIRSQALTVSSKIVEIRLELGAGTITKPMIAMCLSDMSLELENWSTDMDISSTIYIELALFNENLLAWEPLIEPVLDDNGNVVCPWCITCSTYNCEDEEENDEDSRFLLDDPKSFSDNNKQQKQEEKLSLDAKQVIFIRAEHLLNLTVTKSMLDITQRLSGILDQAYNQKSHGNSDEDKAFLSILNMTGEVVDIDHIIGVQFLEDSDLTTPVHLEHKDSVPLTVPKERLSATRIPAISDQIANRKQEFSIKMSNLEKTVDINQTWRRIFDIGPSPITDWPIQLLCDSHLYKDRRRIVLSSIIKVLNRAIMPIIILEIDSVELGTFREVSRIEPDGELYLPLSLLYARITPRLFITIDDAKLNSHGHDCIAFNWTSESAADRRLKLNNGRDAYFVFYKESKEACLENTDEPNGTALHIYFKLALQLINLLSLDVECWIDDVEQVKLEPNNLYHSVSGNKRSMLTFVIPHYKDAKWISEPMDLNLKTNTKLKDYVLIFHSTSSQESLRLMLRVDIYRESYRASLYSVFWVLNCTDLKFEFKIENEKTLIEAIEPPFFVCPKNLDSKKKKGHIRLFSNEQNEKSSDWSEGFSLDTIKITEMVNCKVANDRTYTISVDIATSSFGMTKIITLAPSTMVINKSTIEVEVTEVETTRGEEEEQWKFIKPEGIIPFWPRNIEQGLMRVRYAHNHLAISTFVFKEKQRTLLHMDDRERPALQTDVVISDNSGCRIVFGDYKIGDSPILLVNCLKKRPITFCQSEDIRIQVLSPRHYVYYTWMDQLKPRSLVISSDGPTATIELNPLCGKLETNDQQTVYYATFHDGPQMVLIFAEDIDIIDVATHMPSLAEKMSQHIQIGIRDIGISVIDDIARSDLFYITINKSKEVWTETRNANVIPLSRNLDHHIDEHYKKYIKNLEENPNDEELAKKKYRIDDKRNVSFDENTAELSDHLDHRVTLQRQSFDGLWVSFAWSTTNQALHLRINRFQIDYAEEFTLYPVVLNPIISKALGTDLPGKPFIEMSLFKTESARANTQNIKYLNLLVQEFAFCVDQTLIMSILGFVKHEKTNEAPTINMERDLQRIHKPLEAITDAQSNSLPTEPKIFIDNLHLSPLKIHVSFSMHGTSANEQLLAEYPIVDFLLNVLNIAEVQDAVLKLNCYERKNEQFTNAKLLEEIRNHYQSQLMGQLHVVVLGLDVLGNPFSVIRGVGKGVESFFYEPYKASGAMKGPIEFIEGVAVGTGNLVSSTVGGAAGALSKITGAASQGLATLTFDENYQNARIVRKELAGHSVSGVITSGKNIGKDVLHGFTGIVKKPVADAKKRGAAGFVKGFGKGFIGLVARPASGVADFTSTSFDMIKRLAIHEEVIHRMRLPRHVGRDGIIRPSTSHEIKGFRIYDKLKGEKHGPMDIYVAHIDCTKDASMILMSSLKRLLILTGTGDSLDDYQIELQCHYRDLKGPPTITYEPDKVHINLKSSKVPGVSKKDPSHESTVPFLFNMSQSISPIVMGVLFSTYFLTIQTIEYSLSTYVLNEKQHELYQDYVLFKGNAPIWKWWNLFTLLTIPLTIWATLGDLWKIFTTKAPIKHHLTSIIRAMQFFTLLFITFTRAVPLEAKSAETPSEEILVELNYYQWVLFLLNILGFVITIIQCKQAQYTEPIEAKKKKE
ncbi:unnamed protein product [Adineta steineri]|uniref:Intermembrane lipid transfer protein VPS13-like C-terminal domain-containing protein n=1 Tax=Adineta steineri TaxID=433720 RepID=A0A819FSG0_9BILA|nr:unnamed protein product [Adineta steineri]